jgi:hypothetical protein
VLDQLLDHSDALPLGDRVALGRIVALCDDRSATPLAAVVHVADRLVRRAGSGVEPVVEPTPSALDLACVFDLDAASARLQPLLDAQERFDSRVHAEPIAPANLPEGFAEATDQLR